VKPGTGLAACANVGAQDLTAADAWQLSHELQRLIAKLLERCTLATDCTLRDQLSEAAASSSRHIAEGRGRVREVECALFLTFALGSLAETRTLLRDARDRGYISEDERQRGDLLARRAIAATCTSRSALLRP
jgi:four helix bundle protein